MSLTTSEMCMIATATTGTSTTLEVDEVVNNVAVVDYKLRGFLDIFAI